MNARLAAVLASPVLDPARRSHLRLVRADAADATFIARLRNDPTLNEYLNAPTSDVAIQQHWLERYKSREATDQEFYFVIVSDGVSKGVVRLYDFCEMDGRRSFCWGSWIIAPPSVPGLATYSATMVYKIGFEALGFDQSHFDVRVANSKVIAFHRRAGAEQTGKTEIDRFFVFPRETWPRFRAASARQIAAHNTTNWFRKIP